MENYKGFLSPYQSVSLINWNMVEKPTWWSLGSCKTCQKKEKTLKMSKKFHVGKGWTGRKRLHLCEIIAHNSQVVETGLATGM